MRVLEFPLARITLAFVLGIWVSFYCNPSPKTVCVVLLFSGLVFGILYFLSKQNTVPPHYFGLATYFFALAIGATAQIIPNDSFRKSHYTKQSEIFDNPHWVFISIREKLRSSSFNDRYVAMVSQIDETKRSGKLLVNIQKDSLNHSFEIGTHLKIRGSLYKNHTSKNPNQFDYGKYLENKQIYAQLYTDATKIQTGSLIDKDIWYHTSRWRTRIIRNLQKNHFKSAELSVAIALILGQQQDISPEIIQDYQFAGAVHILSVSGLHIGFILLFVTFLLQPIPNTKRGSLIKLLLILVSLSLFGFIAGFAPSVVRSVVMFSFVAIGMYLRRSTNIYHTLLVSIFLILLFEPSFLFDVGFQLSYIALFFILWLQPLLAQLWMPKNKVLHYFWDILTVSFAAQIGTFPLSVYYFHQFPGLFFVTNLVVIPFLSFIMGLGVLVMLLAAFDLVPLFLAKGLEWSLFILNKIINSIASLEQFIFKDIPLNMLLLISTYLLLVFLILWFIKPNFNRLVASLLAVLILQSSYFATYWNTQNQREFVVFHSKKNSLLTERKGENLTVFANDSLLKTASTNKTLMSYVVGNFSQLQFKKKLQNTLYFQDKKILVLDSLGVYPKSCSPDILVLTQSPKINLDRLFQITKPKMVVADGSNYKTYVRLLETTCQKHKIPFHATGEKGFYRLQ